VRMRSPCPSGMGRCHLPTYYWVLVNRLQGEVMQLKEQAEKQVVILLDYETNCDLADLSHPLSHAGLVKRYLEGQWPTEGRTGQERHGIL
jgi:uncharacterized protein DUF6939